MTSISFEQLNTVEWFNWQQPACPLLLGGCYEACGSAFRERFQIPFFTSILYFRPTENTSERIYGSWLLRLEEGINCGRSLVDLLHIDRFRFNLGNTFVKS